LDGLGTVNTIVQNKFLKLWYKKENAHTLQNISLTKQQGSKEAHEAVITEKLIVINTNTSYEESEDKLEEESTKAPEGETQEGHSKKEEEYRGLHSSKKPHIEESKEE
jgi:hypothetical protein